MRRLLFLFIVVVLMTSCYSSESRQQASQAHDSIRHYGLNYNFVVTSDSLCLLAVDQPIELLNGMSKPESLFVKKDGIVAVADIVIEPNDKVDSVWVELAHDEETVGWIHESELLPKVSPDNPISRFITFFSDTHLLMLLVIMLLLGTIFGFHRLVRKKAKIVHFNDINSFYPTLLTMIVASAAVFYSTIQLANPESWREFYFHPTLNPFSAPLHLGLFLGAVWAMLIVTVAALDDVRRNLTTGKAIFYLIGLVGVCALDYVIFSLSTLYYIGYPLLLAYIVFALYRYFRYNRAHYICGQCGRRIREKGECPYCGAFNQ